MATSKRALPFQPKQYRTHQFLTAPYLRLMLARDLLALRHVVHRSMRQEDGLMNQDYVTGIQMGLSTAFDRVQYFINTGKVPELKLTK